MWQPPVTSFGTRPVSVYSSDTVVNAWASISALRSSALCATRNAHTQATRHVWPVATPGGWLRLAGGYAWPVATPGRRLRLAGGYVWPEATPGGWLRLAGGCVNSRSGVRLPDTGTLSRAGHLIASLTDSDWTLDSGQVLHGVQQD